MQFIKIYLFTDPSKLETVAVMSHDHQDNYTFRLPKEVNPIHYDIYLHPDLNNGTFVGKVNILLYILDKRGQIALHQKDLNITHIKLEINDPDDRNEIELLPHFTVAKYELLVVPIKNGINPGIYNLYIDFNGALQPDKIVGFYSSKYKDENNKTR